MRSRTCWTAAAAGALALGAGIAAAEDDAAEDAVGAADAAPVTAPELTDETFAGLRDFIIPSKEESAWRDIGWYPSLWGAVVEAHAQKKPVLLWAMNGHPLACT